jgi:hypothetical protein
MAYVGLRISFDLGGRRRVTRGHIVFFILFLVVATVIDSGNGDLSTLCESFWNNRTQSCRRGIIDFG